LVVSSFIFKNFWKIFISSYGKKIQVLLLELLEFVEWVPDNLKQQKIQIIWKPLNEDTTTSSRHNKIVWFPREQNK